MTMSRRVLVCLLLAAALHHGFVWLAQRAILFPGAHSGAPWGRAPENAVTITAGGSRALLVPARGATDEPAPLVVYGHGNAEFAEDFFLLPEPYTAAGFHVLILEYRGYGDVAGSPSEEALVADSVALIEAACDRPDVDAARVVYHGRSLGGAILGTVAGRRAPAGLVLEAAFSSVPSMARSMLVPAYLLKDRFDVVEAIRGGRFPVLLLHGEADEVVPPREADVIASALPPTRLTRWSEPDVGHLDSWMELAPERLVAFARSAVAR